MRLFFLFLGVIWGLSQGPYGLAQNLDNPGGDQGESGETSQAAPSPEPTRASPEESETTPKAEVEAKTEPKTEKEPKSESEAEPERDDPYEYTVWIERRSSRRIKGLRWLRKALPAKVREKDGKLRIYTHLYGEFKKKDWALTIGKKKLRLSKKRRFRIKISFKKKKRSFLLTAIGPKGEVEQERVRLVFHRYDDYLADLRDPKRFFWNTGLGLTYISFFDARVPNFQYFALTWKFSMRYLISSPNWDIGLTTFFNVKPFVSTDAREGRFLGINLRVGYRIPGITNPWRFMIMAGTYYLTMIVGQNPPTFGFSGVGGPQLFPVGQYFFSNGQVLTGYFKYSPISDSFALLSLDNRELAGGFAYSFPLGRTQSISINLDVSDLRIEIPVSEGSATTIPISATTISLGTSYSF